MPKKLIEVALPLEAINFHAAKEKSIRHGHPSTLHLWWARRPLAACRAVLLAQLVDDPHDPEAPAEFVAACNRLPKGKNATAEDNPRNRLFDLIEKLVEWKNSNNQKLLAQANELIRLCAGPDGPPPVLDPFAGGGSIPLEAQRLGLEAHASDLNPVAVLINKALIEIPPQFADQPPVNPEARQQMMPTQTKGAQGLAEDVRYYGHWMRQEAEKRIGHLYPNVTITAEMLSQRPDLRDMGLKAGQQLTVIAWLWARTIKCPNPVCGAWMPLISTFWLSRKKKSPLVWLEPVINRKNDRPEIKFIVKTGKGKAPSPPKIGRGAKFECLACQQPAGEEYIRSVFQSKESSFQLIAIVVDGPNGRIYLPANDEHVEIAIKNRPRWKPDETMNTDTTTLISGRGYGVTHWYELFTTRQLIALTTFNDLITEAHNRIRQDVIQANIYESDTKIKTYADAVATYLAMGVSRLSDIANAHCMWENTRTQVRHLFTRQAIPMLWDFGEANIFSEAAGDFGISLGNLTRVVEKLQSTTFGTVKQHDAMLPIHADTSFVISTDPPYYDNIDYADLSDFFYIWLKRSLNSIHSDVFNTILVPKTQELTATSHRFNGDKFQAKEFFESGLKKVFSNLYKIAHNEYPLTVYYAFKQSEIVPQDGSTASTGWETMLEGLVRAGFIITGTWPMRTELSNRMVGQGTNALASSIVLVCRPRPAEALPETRRGFIKALKRELPAALKELQQGNIAPVDLAQASIGPGMAIFSRHPAILEADGSPMPVRQALMLINQALDEFMTEQEGTFDLETRWATAWFSQYHFEAGPYGEAETLAMSKNISVAGLVEAGIVEATGGQVRLISREALSLDWSPAAAKRLTVWGLMQQCVRAHWELGDMGVARLISLARGESEEARGLAYRLYALCERQNWASESQVYNNLVTSWPEILKLLPEVAERQMRF